MMTASIIVLEEHYEDTIDEAWQNGPNPLYPYYGVAADAAVKNLGHGFGRRCLVIGSPRFEAEGLHKVGWMITYLDVRMPPDMPFDFVQADASNLPFPDGTFDALSSTCVLCHAGLGRYGDTVDEHGDAKVLGEMARVLKPGGKAAVMFGPTMPILEESFTIGKAHRIYAKDDALKMIRSVGLDPIAGWIWQGGKPEEMPDGSTNVVYSYLFFLLEKRCN